MLFTPMNPFGESVDPLKPFIFAAVFVCSIVNVIRKEEKYFHKVVPYENIFFVIPTITT